jgi:geranylgeranyl diphosphate synthase type II
MLERIDHAPAARALGWSSNIYSPMTTPARSPAALQDRPAVAINLDMTTPPAVRAATPAPEAHLDEIVAPTGEIDAYLDELSGSTTLPTNLAAAIRYSLLGPGKRLRPILSWHCAAAVGADPRVSLPAGAAVELIHAFSLVHDDLPGIDNDDLRRGRPTLHKHTSEAMAILAGDAMLTLGFEILTDRIDDPRLANRLVRELAAGTSAMIAGQVYDTLGGFESSGVGVSPADRLNTIHQKKTGALIRAACRMGVLSGLHSLSSSTTGPLDAITAYADAVGLMFQVVDDLLDVTQTTAHLGKRSGKDIDAGKLTFPGVHGVDRSREYVRELHHASLAALEPLGAPAEPLRQLASYMAVRTR